MANKTIYIVSLSCETASVYYTFLGRRDYVEWDLPTLEKTEMVYESYNSMIESLSRIKAINKESESATVQKGALRYKVHGIREAQVVDNMSTVDFNNIMEKL